MPTQRFLPEFIPQGYELWIVWGDGEIFSQANEILKDLRNGAKISQEQADRVISDAGMTRDEIRAIITSDEDTGHSGPDRVIGWAPGAINDSFTPYGWKPGRLAPVTIEQDQECFGKLHAPTGGFATGKWVVGGSKEEAIEAMVDVEAFAQSIAVQVKDILIENPSLVIGNKEK